MPMYQPEIETMSQEQIRKLQSERLVKQVRHVYDNVPYYRAKMEEKGITPEDIHGVEDLHKLPFLYPARCGPLGGLLRPGHYGRWRHRRGCGPCLLWLWSVHRRCRPAWRLPQGAQLNAPHVLGEHRPANPVHV